MAKVYLTKAGCEMSGSRNQEDLNKAAEYARDVINNSGRNLLPNYEDIFRLKNNKNEEALISWHWVVSSKWTSQNSLQSDLGMAGFSEFTDTWGDWNAPSVDLQDAFGVQAIDNPESRIANDVRRKATLMMSEIGRAHV